MRKLPSKIVKIDPNKTPGLVLVTLSDGQSFWTRNGKILPPMERLNEVKP